MTKDSTTSSTKPYSSYDELVKNLTKEDVLREFPDVIPTTVLSKATRDSTDVKEEDASLFAGHDEEQIRLMDEMCIVLDYNDTPIGAGSKKTCHIYDNIEKGLLHRAFSVFLFNDEGKLLLQQRATEKITFPDLWTNTCCSHPLAVSSEVGTDLESAIKGVKNAAQRKLDHELGIKAEYIPIENFKFLTRIHYKSPSGDDGAWGEHEIDYILFIRANPVVEPSRNEVRDEKYVTPEELKQMFKDPELKFTPWFELICNNYLFNWWTDIDGCDKFFNPEIVHMI